MKIRPPSSTLRRSVRAGAAAQDQARERTSEVGTARRILEAAIEEFARLGLSGARVDEIARRAGVNKQLIYHYFGGKDMLFESALEEVFIRTRTDDHKFEKSLEGLTPVDSLELFIDYMCSSTWNNLTFQKIVMDDAMSGAPHLKRLESVPRSYANVLNILENILERGAVSGDFRPGVDVRELYVSMMAMFGVRITNAATLAISIGIPLSTPYGLKRSQNWVKAFLRAALRP